MNDILLLDGSTIFSNIDTKLKHEIVVYIDGSTYEDLLVKEQCDEKELLHLLTCLFCEC